VSAPSAIKTSATASGTIRKVKVAWASECAAAASIAANPHAIGTASAPSTGPARRQCAAAMARAPTTTAAKIAPRTGSLTVRTTSLADAANGR
jgi:hypothetical protein